MFAGILAGFTWAIETIILGIALAMSPFCTTAQAIFLAPFVSTFLHDFCSAIFATIYNAVRGNAKNVWKALFKTKTGKWVSIAAVIGGPIGMTGYVMAVNYMGASIGAAAGMAIAFLGVLWMTLGGGAARDLKAIGVGAVASAIFPAIGTVLARIFLKEKMKWYQWIFLVLTLLGVYGLSYSPELSISNFWLGLAGALMCAFGWGIEAVILAKCLKDPEVTDEYALQIRQTTSALTYGIIILPLLKGWGFTLSLFSGSGMLLPTIAAAALFATASYLFYYRAISQIGASKSMALNVSYSAWAILITVVILRDTSVLTPLTILCAVVVLVCGILAAADFRELFKKNAA